jgi:hypothetical protein
MMVGRCDCQAELHIEGQPGVVGEKFRNHCVLQINVRPSSQCGVYAASLPDSNSNGSAGGGLLLLAHRRKVAVQVNTAVALLC